MPIMISIVALVLAVTSPLWGPALWDDDNSSAVKTLETQQAVLVETIAELDKQVTALAVGQEGLATSMAAVKVPAILIVADDLRDEIASGDAFAETLNLFRAIVGEGEETLASVFELDPWSEVGIPTEDGLQRSFDDVSHNIVASLQTVESNGDLAQRMSQTMADLTAATTRLRWRLDGPPEGDDVFSILARADSDVRSLAFDDAIAEIQKLPDDLKAMTETWVASVGARDLADQARSDLDLYMIEAVARSR